LPAWNILGRFGYRFARFILDIAVFIIFGAQPCESKAIREIIDVNRTLVDVILVGQYDAGTVVRQPPVTAHRRGEKYENNRVIFHASDVWPHLLCINLLLSGFVCM